MKVHFRNMVIDFDDELMEKYENAYSKKIDAKAIEEYICMEYNVKEYEDVKTHVSAKDIKAVIENCIVSELESML